MYKYFSLKYCIEYDIHYNSYVNSEGLYWYEQQNPEPSS